MRLTLWVWCGIALLSMNTCLGLANIGTREGLSDALVAVVIAWALFARMVKR